MSQDFSRWSVLGAVCLLVGAVGCGHDTTEPISPPPPPPVLTVPPTTGADAGTVDAGVPPTEVDAGTPPVDAGTPEPADAGFEPPADAGVPDAGVPDGGTADAGVPVTASAWPSEPVMNYSSTYHLPSLRGVTIDEGQNIWVLTSENRIGVLRAGSSKVELLPGDQGQVGRGYSATCICGGEAGRAYVGFWAHDPESMDERYSSRTWRFEDPSAGDVDVVHLDGTGKLAFEQHMNLFNSNDHHWNEVQGIFTCTRVNRGPFRNEVYVGSNHAVTRIRGLEYADHRHAVWDVDGSLRIGYNKAVGIAQNGDLLMGNEWKVAILTPPPALMDFINFDVTPWRMDTFVRELGSLEDMDYWLATAQTTDGLYYWGGQKGLWQAVMTPRQPQPDPRLDPQWSRIEHIGEVDALAATDDGSLFIGTGSGLFRMKPDKTLEAVDVPGNRVINLVYDGQVTPSMLLVLTNGGLTVLRGF